jgi:hypothetical protein
VPAISLVALILAALALSAPAEPDVLIPLVSLPPVDAYQDVAVVDLGVDGTLQTWVLRLLFWGLRIALFGTFVALAVDRARGRAPELAAALRRVRERVSTLAFLELLSFGAFGATLVLRAGVEEARTDGSIAGALLFGLLFLPNAFVAAVSDGLPAGTALRRSLGWTRHKPLGHLVLIAGYAAALNGLGALATAGETGRLAAFPLTLLAFAAAVVTAIFLVALARRYELLYSDRTSAPAPPRPGLRALLEGPAPAERTRDRRAARGGRGPSPSPRAPDTMT